MADDARTEARRRIAKALFEGSGKLADTGMEQLYEREAEQLADAVLDDLFPTVFWMPADGATWREQFLMLRGPVEPVTEEREPCH